LGGARVRRALIWSDCTYTSKALQPKPRRSGAVTFGDLVGRLDLLRVNCAKCDHKGQYRVTALVERYGPEMGLPDWKDQLTADCPRRANLIYASGLSIL
jgi:hypothetical protein